jgi:hypothetical protein
MFIPDRHGSGSRMGKNPPDPTRPQPYSYLLPEEREIEGLKRQKKKKKDLVYLFVCLFFFFFVVNWSYFIMGLLYWDPILEALSLYGKNFGPYFFF